ncbi:MAG TPA: hypothetical protein VGY91_03375 [Chthoniobacterales bacterium]|nr:hypothetical protein [Chthoniobacterales bacterium]
MSDVISQIGLALKAFKARQQDINGLGQRAFKDLFAAANVAMLTAVVQKIIQTSYAEMVTAHPPRTTLLAAASQHHTEIMAGCRILTQDDGILRALIDAANAATSEAFQLIYAEQAKSPLRSRTRKTEKVLSPESEPAKRRTRTPRKAVPDK